MRFFTILFLAALALAQPSPTVKPVPPPGVEVPAVDRKELEAGIKRLNDAMAPLRQHPDWKKQQPEIRQSEAPGKFSAPMDGTAGGAMS